MTVDSGLLWHAKKYYYKYIILIFFSGKPTVGWNFDLILCLKAFFLSHCHSFRNFRFRSNEYHMSQMRKQQELEAPFQAVAMSRNRPVWFDRFEVKIGERCSFVMQEVRRKEHVRWFVLETSRIDMGDICCNIAFWAFLSHVLPFENVDFLFERSWSRWFLMLFGSSMTEDRLMLPGWYPVDV